MRGWTYGAEHELVDWDRRRPHTWALDMRDVTMVNNNGIAVDPKARLYHLGGEVNTRPTDTPGGQADQMVEFLAQFPEAAVNYRSNLHVHVRVPGLRDNLLSLKRVQRFAHRWLPKLLPLIEPIPLPYRDDYPEPEAFAGARKRFLRRKVSHQKLLSPEILARQYRARTTEEFFDAEALHVPTGKLHWAIHPRAAMNLRQLRETDTVEFRHFPGTIDPLEIQNAVTWCATFMEMAEEDMGDPVNKWHTLNSVHRHVLQWPKFYPYDHALELGYQLTSSYVVGEAAARINIEKRLKR